jgi:signal transduction histidine kinase
MPGLDAMSLRWRWALSIAIVGVLAVAATTGIGLVTTERELRAQVDHDLVNRFELASRAVPAAPLRRPFDQSDRDPFEVPAEDVDPNDLVGLDAVIQVTVGRTILVPGEPALPPRSYRALSDGPVLETVQIEGNSYRMISGQVQGPRLMRVDRVVQLAISVEDIDAAIALLFGRLALIGIALSVIAGLVGWMLARTAVRPIEELTVAADAITGSIDTDHRLPTGAPGEVGRLAGSFRMMLESLRSSQEQQQRLIADAGHEFRTPLTALRTNIETLLRRSDQLSAEQRDELLAAALDESLQLAALAEELVDLATDSQSPTEETTQLDLAEVAQTVARRFTQRSGVQIEVTGTSVPVTGRSAQLERALSNLVDNAIKWSPSGAGVEIVVGGRTVSVRDHGPGIPEADLELIFERFHRSVEARTTPGSGLGLAIVEHIVTAHGGTVFARNLRRGGAEVGFSIN